MSGKYALLLLLALPMSFVAADESVPQPPAHAHVELQTTEGRILIELDGKAAPYSVDHFLTLVDAGHYNNTIFHRVIPDFMIQAGGYTPDLKPKEKDDYVVNESGNGVSHLRGTVALARLSRPHTANAQFFINLKDNTHLNPGKGRWGYTVFGYVIEGMDVVDKIAAVPTGPKGNLASDVPQVPIVIKSASRFTFE